MTWEWRDEALHIHWFLTTEEQELLSNKTPHGRLGFAVLLKHFQNEGRFPEHFKDVPHVVLMYLANQIDVPRSSLEDYALDGRTARGSYHIAAKSAICGSSSHVNLTNTIKPTSYDFLLLANTR